MQSYDYQLENPTDQLNYLLDSMTQSSKQIASIGSPVSMLNNNPATMAMNMGGQKAPSHTDYLMNSMSKMYNYASSGQNPVAGLSTGANPMSSYIPNQISVQNPAQNPYMNGYNPYPVNSYPLNNVFNANSLVNQKKPFNPNDKSKMGIDYTGTNIGEYYHILQYMQESMATITNQKPLFIDFNGNPVSQEFASKETTGNVPFFDAVSESYGWMAKSPYYQDYVQHHINSEHGGVHDVITPRGYDPEQFLQGAITPQISWSNEDVYKTPYAKPVTVTDPRLNLF